VEGKIIWNLKILRVELYGPQDGEAISSAADAVANGVELILEELPGGEEEGTPLHALAEASNAALAQLAARVAALRAPDGDRANLSSEE
jgi:hypothetical protein